MSTTNYLYNAFNSTSKYDDIINMPHHSSYKRAHMSLHDRAAQFSPFAALTGYDDSVKEAARITESEIILSEEEKSSLNTTLHFLLDKLGTCGKNDEKPLIKVTYFVKDSYKSGGSYITRTGTLNKIDTDKHNLIIDELLIFFDDIIEISPV